MPSRNSSAVRARGQWFVTTTHEARRKKATMNIQMVNSRLHNTPNAITSRLSTLTVVRERP